VGFDRDHTRFYLHVRKNLKLCALAVQFQYVAFRQISRRNDSRCYLRSVDAYVAADDRVNDIDLDTVEPCGSLCGANPSQIPSKQVTALWLS
jgi:hypothetical protein